MWQVSYFVYGCIKMYKIKNENPGSVALYSCAPISNHKLSEDVTSEYVNGGVGCVLISGRGEGAICCPVVFASSLMQIVHLRIMDETQELPPITQ